MVLQWSSKSICHFLYSGSGCGLYTLQKAVMAFVATDWEDHSSTANLQNPQYGSVCRCCVDLAVLLKTE